MKENWMNKLIKLLNEYEKENWRNFEVKEIWMTYRNNDLMVISKRYWFIKWLVDNKKIDYEKCIKEFRIKDFRKFYYMSKADNVIANLAIQENPISFLISILE